MILRARTCRTSIGSLKMWILSILCFGLFFISSVNCLAVMSVDLGSEWMKIAVVSPGVPMEIALNKESKRKTAVAVALRGEERTFGSDALAVCTKYPQKCYFYLLDLVGKPFDHPAVKLYQERFPYYTLEADPDRGTVLFRHDETTTYSPEELLGMILTHAKHIAEEYTEQKPIRDIVLTVPAYFNQAERRALKGSVELAGLNLLQLITEPLAVSLNYGMFRRKEINGTVKHLMFYDMGAYDTTVSIVGYTVVKTKERGFSETHPQAQILGLGYDRSLGGLELQIKLREHLADQFNKLKKPKTDVRKNPRAMAKLFKEAGRVKNVLSANNQIFAQVENVMDDIDFKIEITRDDFLAMNQGYFDRVLGPAERAIAASGMTLGEIHEIILAGAGTRVPKVQEMLNDFIGKDKELGKNLNTDEAAAMGAVYKAADLSTGFRVKKFITKEAVIFPIEVEFERKYEDDDGKEASRQVKKNLFPPMNSYAQKKIMTFNKFTTDFNFDVHYNELEHLGKTEVPWIGKTHLSHVEVEGVPGNLEKHKDAANTESKGIKAHFNIDDSGLLHVTGIESVFEKTITVEEQEKAEAERIAKEEAEKAKNNKTETETADQETEGDKKEGDEDSWAKLGDTISSYFGAKEDEEKKGDKDSKESEKDKKKKDKKKDKKKEKKEEKKPEKKVFKPIVETIKEPLEFKLDIVDFNDLSKEQFEASREKLKALDARDEAKAAQERAMNALETEVIDTKDKMYQEIYEKSTTDEEREKIMSKCNEISDWIDEEATFETPVETLQSKQKEITDLTAPMHARVKQHTDRPEALEAMNKMINSSEYFLSKAKNSTGIVDGYFTQEEIDKLDNKIKETKDWRDQALKDQEAQPMYEMPKMTTSLIAEKALDMDKEVKFLYNKVKIGKAKAEKDKAEADKKKEKKKKKKAKEAETEEGSGEETVEGSGEQAEEETVETPEKTEETTESETPDVTEETPETQEGSEETPETQSEDTPETETGETNSEESAKKEEEAVDDLFDEKTAEETHTEL